MFPLRDANPTRHVPVVTITLILLNVLMWLYELLLMGSGHFEQSIMQMALVPSEFTQHFGPEAVVDLFRSMFMHAGWVHLIGNMWYLWLFGDNVEDSIGWFGFLVFYLICGVAAGLAQVVLSPNSSIPLIGASGAIAGVLGAYLVRFPKARVLTVLTLGWYIRLAEIPALYVLGFWFVLQLLSSVASIGIPQQGGVAYFAHIGGFVAGLVMMWIFARRPAADTHYLD
jgi:membrane associated rhomboid family serine protease